MTLLESLQRKAQSSHSRQRPKAEGSKQTNKTKAKTKKLGKRNVTSVSTQARTGRLYFSEAGRGWWPPGCVSGEGISRAIIVK